MYDRPMEMMSQRERQGVRDVRDNMNRMPEPDAKAGASIFSTASVQSTARYSSTYRML